MRTHGFEREQKRIYGVGWRDGSKGEEERGKWYNYISKNKRCNLKRTYISNIEKQPNVCKHILQVFYI